MTNKYVWIGVGMGASMQFVCENTHTHTHTHIYIRRELFSDMFCIYQQMRKQQVSGLCLMDHLQCIINSVWICSIDFFL